MTTLHACSIPYCDKPVHGHLLCNTHYRRWKATGDPVPRLRLTRRMSTEERLWYYTNITNDETSCWLWTGPQNHHGYGRISHKRTRALSAHRVAWELANGPIPPGLCVLHTCDTPTCVRNDGEHSHLFLGTQLDNMQDRQRKGRTPQGERSGNAKLTNVQARALYDLRWKISRAEAAQRFGISIGYVSHIWNHRARNHLHNLD